MGKYIFGQFFTQKTVNRNEKHAIDGTNSSERFLLLEFLAVENVDFETTRCKIFMKRTCEGFCWTRRVEPS
jgi:hypothetical protein